MKRMLVATAEGDAQRVLTECFRSEYDVDMSPNGTESLRMFQENPYEIVFVDIAFLSELGVGENIRSYRNTLKLFWSIFPSVQMVVLCTQEEIRRAVEAVQAGASNYLAYPVDRKEARYVLQTTYAAIRMQSELDYLRDQFWRADSADLIQTNNLKMREVFAKVRMVAPADTTVLICGETGTGKGVVANLIHRHCTRRDKQFISVHCGAIPENLIESELFGHERGAFTGAVRRKLGKFEIAHGGTIFLDEVGTMPLAAQVKLLQVLQDRVYQRVGGEDIIPSNVRVIAASNTDLEAMTEGGGFRRDLYYRLNVFPIELPPLRERREDIPLLADLFLNDLNKRHLKGVSRIHPDVFRAFQTYAWPGNIRELENLMERAYLLEGTDVLTPSSFPRDLFEDAGAITATPLDTSLTLAQVRSQAVSRIEAEYLRKQLESNNGSIKGTASTAGVTPRQLHKLLAKHGLRKEEYKRRTARN